MHTVKHH